MAEPVPIRDLGKYGIIKDTAPFDLPVNAWSDGANVVFVGNRITSAPVFRNLTDVASVEGLPEAPTFVSAMDTASGFDPIVLATRDFRFHILLNNILTDASPEAIPAGVSDARYTSASLGGVFYVNRKDQVPVYYDGLTGKMKAVPSWDTSWRCNAFRAFKDFAIALNVTKGSTEYPTMVKWSDAVIAGATPGTWDTTALNSLAGENTITEATTALIDGGPLKNDFIIYSGREVFVMEFIGAPMVFSFRRVFNDDGVMAENCFVEVQGKHYVFGQKDIYVHDGLSKKSIAEGRVKAFIYDQLDASKADHCFAFHMPKLNSVFFCYPSAVNEVFFKATPYCNRAAVYNYVNDVWSFMDVPNITSASFANVDTKLTYDEAESYTYDVIGGTYADQEDSYIRHVILTSVKAASSGVSASRVLALDDATETKVAKPSVSELSPGCFVSRTGLALEQLGFTIQSRKLSATMYPLVQMVRDDADFTVAFGKHDNPDAFPSEEEAIPFNPKTQYKVDTRNTGRFVTMRFDFPVVGGVYLSGYDIDVRRVSLR